MSWVYFLKHKSEVFDVFVKFCNMILAQFYTHIQILCYDNGGEYVSLTMKQFIHEHGMIRQTTCPNTPKQNGVAERKNRTLLEMSRALMFEFHVPAYIGQRLLLLLTISLTASQQNLSNLRPLLLL